MFYLRASSNTCYVNSITNYNAPFRISNCFYKTNANNDKKSDKWRMYFEKQQTRYRCRQKIRLAQEKNFEDIHIMKRFALLMGYSGVGYYGMQRNTGLKTIEEDLLKALFKANLISTNAFKTVQTIKFQRVSRTDKGVSAATQVVSLFLPEFATKELINSHLPDIIRIFAIQHVTKYFDAKRNCDARTYTYTLPTYALEKDMYKLCDKTTYRITESSVQYFEKLLQNYVGLKNFHNFTENRPHGDPASVRNIKLFKIDNLFIAKNVEFAVLKVKGRGFMLHQIRKMVALALAIVGGFVPEAIMGDVFKTTNLDTPTAPALGLILDQLHYAKYNQQNKDFALTWDDIKHEVEEFKKKVIISNIIDVELKDNSMATWLEELAYYPEHVGWSTTDKCVDLNI